MTLALYRLLRILALSCPALFAGACTFGPNAGSQFAAFDFGPRSPAPDSGPRISKAMVVYEVSAPVWLDTTAIYYRLAYRDPARPQAYAGSRWVTSPAGLFTARLRERLIGAGGGVILPTDGLRAPAALRVELDEFAQVFDAPDRSRAVLRLRASLLGQRALIAQRLFSVEVPARTADAEGGAKALAVASDQAMEQLLSWAAVALRD